MSRSRLLIAAAVVSFCVPSLSWAQEAVDVVNTPASPVPTTVTNYNQIDSAIVSAIQDLAGQNTSNATALGKEMANISDVQNQAQVKYGIDQARLAALAGAQSGPGDCNALENSATMAAFGADVARQREQLASMNNQWFDNSPTINGQPNPASAGQVKADRKMLQAECANGFESNMDNMAGACGIPNSKMTVTSNPNAGLDTEATKLLGSMDFSPKDATAAQMFMSHLLTPQPLPPISPTDVMSGDGPKLLAERKAIESRLSTARLFVSTAIANRQIQIGPTDPGIAFYRGEASQLNGHIPEQNGTYFPNGVSNMDVMEVDADAPLLDSKYIAGLDQMNSDPALLREVIHLLAFNNYLLWQKYKQDEQIGLMEAAQMASGQAPATEAGATPLP